MVKKIGDRFKIISEFFKLFPDKFELEDEHTRECRRKIKVNQCYNIDVEHKYNLYEFVYLVYDDNDKKHSSLMTIFNMYLHSRIIIGDIVKLRAQVELSRIYIDGPWQKDVEEIFEGWQEEIDEEERKETKVKSDLIESAKEKFLENRKKWDESREAN